MPIRGPASDQRRSMVNGASGFGRLLRAARRSGWHETPTPHGAPSRQCRARMNGLSVGLMTRPVTGVGARCHFLPGVGVVGDDLQADRIADVVTAGQRHVPALVRRDQVVDRVEVIPARTRRTIGKAHKARAMLTRRQMAIVVERQVAAVDSRRSECRRSSCRQRRRRSCC